MSARQIWRVSSGGELWIYEDRRHGWVGDYASAHHDAWGFVATDQPTRAAALKAARRELAKCGCFLLRQVGA